MATVSWNSSLSVVDKVKDDSWCFQHLHQTPQDCVFRFKTGNKIYSLSSSIVSEVNNEKKIASELGLFRKYRQEPTSLFFYLCCINYYTTCWSSDILFLKHLLYHNILLVARSIPSTVIFAQFTSRTVPKRTVPKARSCSISIRRLASSEGIVASRWRACRRKSRRYAESGTKTTKIR